MLKKRGWTDALIRDYLGKEDSWEPVNYWEDWRGKRAYYQTRVIEVEGSEEFCQAFLRSVHRRRLDENRVEEFYLERN